MKFMLYHGASGRTPQFSEALRQARLPTHENPVAVHPGSSRVPGAAGGPQAPGSSSGLALWASTPDLGPRASAPSPSHGRDE